MAPKYLLFCEDVLFVCEVQVVSIFKVYFHEGWVGVVGFRSSQDHHHKLLFLLGCVCPSVCCKLLVQRVHAIWNLMLELVFAPVAKDFDKRLLRIFWTGIDVED